MDQRIKGSKGQRDKEVGEKIIKALMDSSVYCFAHLFLYPLIPSSSAVFRLTPIHPLPLCSYTIRHRPYDRL